MNPSRLFTQVAAGIIFINHRFEDDDLRSGAQKASRSLEREKERK